MREIDQNQNGIVETEEFLQVELIHCFYELQKVFFYS
jgi:hypothetical protein